MNEFVPDPSQARVISCSGNLCLTAGAGSGKTGTLVAGIIRRLEEACRLNLDLGVENILALTFTKKASAEMRRRLAEAFQERRRRAAELLQAEPDPDQRKSLEHAQTFWKEQQTALIRADIGTIDSYALKVVKENSAYLGLAGDWNLEDEARLSEADIRNVLLDWLDARRPELLNLLAVFPFRRLEELFTAAYGRLSAWGLAVPWTEPADGPSGLRRLWGRLREAITMARAGLAASGLTPKHKTYHQALALLDGLAPALSHGPEPPGDWAENLPGWRDLLTACRTREPQPFNRHKLALREALDNLEYWPESQRLVPLKEALVQLLTELPERAAEYQKKRGALGFNDVLLSARRLLAENPALRRRQIVRYRHIVVDEFQDTNRLQADLLAWLLASPEDDRSYPEDCNPWSRLDWESLPSRLSVYGDLKQAIYRFRGAEVEIMETLRQRLQTASAGRTLALSFNYRSQAPLVAFFNAFFSGYLKHFEAGLDSQEAAIPALYDGPQTAWLTSEERPARAADRARGQADILLAYLARLFSGESGVLVRDGRAGRLPRPEDVAILFRRSKFVPIFQEALPAAGWPCRLLHDDDPFQYPEVRGLISAFCVLCGLDEDLHLAGLSMSPLGPVSPSALALLTRPNPEGGTPVALKEYFLADRPWPPGPSTEDLEALDRLRRLLHALRPLVGRRPATEIMELLAEKTRLIPLAMTRLDGPVRVRALQRVLALTRTLVRDPETNPESVAGELLNCWRRGNRGREAETDEPDGAISLLTVHRSKGLEFPVVIVAEADLALFKPLDRLLIGPDARLALNLPKMGREIKPDDYRRLAEMEKNGEEAEHRRLLYVAATRARDHLAFIGWPQTSSQTSVSRSWLEALLAWPEIDHHMATWRLEDLESRESGAMTVQNLEAKSPAPHWPDRILEYAGPLGEATREPNWPVTTLARRLTASEAEQEAGSLPGQSETGRFSSGRLTPQERGSLFHGVLENLDYSRFNDPAALVIEEGQRRGLSPSPEEIDYLAKRIGLFVESALGREIAAAWRNESGLYRELPFWLRAAGPQHGQTLFLTGTVDLFYTRPDGSGRIIDYKLARLHPQSAALRAYRIQVLVYAQALRSAGFQGALEACLYFAGDDPPSICQVHLDENLPMRPVIEELHRRWAELVDSSSSGVADGSFHPQNKDFEY